MAGGRVLFFAAGDDLPAVIRAVRGVLELRFMQAGRFETGALTSSETLVQREPQDYFLVHQPAVSVVIRAVEQRRGGTAWFVDQRGNPETIVLRPGGRIGDAMLLHGEASTISAHPDSRALFQAFKNELSRTFGRIKEYRVGPEATRLLDSGARLVGNVRAPPKYDLRRE